MKILGKVTLITGASAGIGAACAAEFRRRGALLALTGRDEARLRATAAEGEFVLAGDLGDAGFRARLMDAVRGHFGRIDILINNAGAGLFATPTETSLEEARTMFELNLMAPLDLAQRAAVLMRARRGGMIVNISSIAGKLTLPWLTMYSASKSALCALTEGLRMELRGERIHAMAVCPGYVLTGFADNALGSPPPASMKTQGWMSITADECARAVARGVETDAHTVVTPGAGRLLIWLARLLPGMLESILSRANRKMEQQA